MRFLFYENIKESWKKQRDIETSKALPGVKTIGSVILVIILISVAAYFQTIPGYFLSDDFEFLYIFDKYDSFSKNILFDYFHKFGFVRPVSLLSLDLNYLIGKLNPPVFHGFNLFIHILNSVLVFLIFFYTTRDKGLSIFSAFLFSLYPIHSEAVAWISGRFDILCAFFYLISILFFLISQKNNSRVSIYYFLSLITFIFALFSKEMALTLPVSLILFDIFFPRNRRPSQLKDALKIHSPFWIILVSYLVFRILYLENLGANFYSANHLLQGNVLLEIKNLFSRLFGPLFIPLNKSLYPDYVLLESLIIAVFTVLVITIPFRRRLDSRILLFSLLFLFVTVIPLYKILFVSETLEGARFLYLPSVGASLIIANLLKISCFMKESINKRMNIVVPFIVLSLFMFALLKNESPWIRASEISKEISYKANDKIQNIKSSGIVYALKIPDNYKGAYIYRNGFSAALNLLGKPENIEIVDLKKISRNQLIKESTYLALIWEKSRFKLCNVSYSYILSHMDE
jgi:hypothetical protein